MSERSSEIRSKSLLIRSACMVALLGFSYCLQHFNEAHQLSLLEDGSASRLPGLAQSDFSLARADLKQASDRLKTGDIVFRAGNTWLSNMAEQVADDVTYTHVGMIVRDGNQIKVVHASIEGDSLVETLGNRVVEEPLADFLRKGNATHAAIYRLQDAVAEASPNLPDAASLKSHSASPKGRKASAAGESAGDIADSAAAFAHAYAEKSAPFDPGFDLSTPDKVYCTELIWRAYLDAGVDLADQGLESFAFPFSGRYLMPDALAKSEHLQPVYQFNQIHAVQSSIP